MENYQSSFIKVVGCASIAYILVGLYRFKKQDRIYKNGLPFPHQLMSHRGGSREYVENTMPAFRYSAGIQVDLLEMDVQLTKDGQVVIFHDNTLERMCGVKNTIADFNYDELPPILIPEDLLSNPKVVNDPESTKIPLFTDLLEEFPLYPMQIDVKHGKDELVLKVGNLIKEYKREHVTVWGSFISSSNDLCFKYFGTSIPLFLGFSRCMKAYALWKVGLIDLMGFRESALIMPNLNMFMHAGWIKALGDRGISTIVFGSDGKGALNSVELWEQARLAGANGICTDLPSELQKWLRTNQMKLVE
jgi:hypothetical protein